MIRMLTARFFHCKPLSTRWCTLINLIWSCTIFTHLCYPKLCLMICEVRLVMLEMMLLHFYHRCWLNFLDMFTYWFPSMLLKIQLMIIVILFRIIKILRFFNFPLLLKHWSWRLIISNMIEIFSNINILLLESFNTLL